MKKFYKLLSMILLVAVIVSIPVYADTSTESSETKISEEEYIAVELLTYFVNNLKNPHSFHLYRVSVSNRRDYGVVELSFEYSAKNELGGETEDIRFGFLDDEALAKKDIKDVDFKAIIEDSPFMSIGGIGYLFKVTDSFKKEEDGFTVLDPEKIEKLVMNNR